MKTKIIFSVICLLMMASGALAAGDLFLKICPQNGPEHGSYIKYFVLKPEEKSREIEDSVSGDRLFNGQTMRVDKIVDYLFVVGQGGEELIMKAYKNPGVIFHNKYISTTEKENGFSNWGFRKKLILSSLVETYQRLPYTTPIISVEQQIVEKQVSQFFGWTIPILFVIFILGAGVLGLIMESLEKKISFPTDQGAWIAIIALISLSIASIRQTLACGLEFSLIALFIFLLPTIMVLTTVTVGVIKRLKKKKTTKAASQN